MDETDDRTQADERVDPTDLPLFKSLRSTSTINPRERGGGAPGDVLRKAVTAGSSAPDSADTTAGRGPDGAPDPRYGPEDNPQSESMWAPRSDTRRALRRPVSTATGDRDALRGPGASEAAEFWALVRTYREQAVDRLASAIADDTMDQRTREELARGIILDLVADNVDSDVRASRLAPSESMQERLAKAVFDAIYRLGRLQPILDDPFVEDVMITGCDEVWLKYSGGQFESGPAVADTDEELVEYLAFLASREGRSFSPAEPYLDLNLGDKTRLAASCDTPRPVANIRVHGLRAVGLPDLVERDMFTQTVADFLSAATRARLSIVFSGPQGGGKTTLMRAVAHEIDPFEVIVTAETERELFLHTMPERHKIVRPFQARLGSGERGPDGSRLGQITLPEIVTNSLRYNADRTLVGEVRGLEAIPMITAMQSGGGSMSTVHANHARGGAERIITCCMTDGKYDEAWARRQVGDHISLVVQVAKRSVDGKQHRYISEIVALEPGDTSAGGIRQIAFTDVFTAQPGSTVALPVTMPDWLRQAVTEHGFDMNAFNLGRTA